MARSLPKNPKASSPTARAVMRANRAKDTSPELAVRKLLRAKGLTGYRLHWITPAGKVDIAFVRRGIAIEVHGCFWHSCPKCQLRTPRTNKSFWKHKFRLNMARDKRKLSHLQTLGWDTYTIWECETRNPDFSLQKPLLRRLIHDGQ